MTNDELLLKKILTKAMLAQLQNIDCNYKLTKVDNHYCLLINYNGNDYEFYLMSKYD